MEPPMDKDDATAEFFDFMVETVDINELDSLAFEIGVDPDDLDGDTLEERTRSLLHFLAQRNDLQILDFALRDLYPVQYGQEFADDLQEDAQVARGEIPEADGYLNEATRIELVRIPAGPFDYGDLPTEQIELGGFYISRTPVTNSQYKLFLDANPDYPVPYIDAEWARPFNWDRDLRLYPIDKVGHPVTLVNWEDALAFCKWAGMRLPTEQEWEKAARGTDARLFPWGDTEPSPESANFGDDVGQTSEVDAYPPRRNRSPFGCVDMAGNVWEWTGSWYDLAADHDLGTARVLRGGAWNSQDLELQTFFRLGREPHVREATIGFRVAK
ncbi:MAG: SUMF1/EgtB/PvdO family nonheme iron enzyme [Chloroflexota bacterium]|jgi:formylglycine-generating enzyme required for sulfatase activity